MRDGACRHGVPYSRECPQCERDRTAQAPEKLTGVDGAGSKRHELVREAEAVRDRIARYHELQEKPDQDRTEEERAELAAIRRGRLARATSALIGWHEYECRAPLYAPGPADYSRPFGDASDYTDPHAPLWYLVEEELRSMGAGGASRYDHPLRQLLRHVARGGEPETFDWSRILLGYDYLERRWILGMEPGLRARQEVSGVLKRLADRVDRYELEAAVLRVPRIIQ